MQKFPNPLCTVLSLAGDAALTRAYETVDLIYMLSLVHMLSLDNVTSDPIDLLSLIYNTANLTRTDLISLLSMI